MIRALLVLLLLPSTAFGWNALGHKVVADIAWDQLDAKAKESITEVLRRHPKFDQDFAKEMPADVDEGRWIFQQAAIWPDIVRGYKDEDFDAYHHGTWHYINNPYFIDGQPAPPDLNLTSHYPTQMPSEKWNVVQAVKHCRATEHYSPGEPVDGAPKDQPPSPSHDP